MSASRKTRSPRPTRTVRPADVLPVLPALPVLPVPDAGEGGGFPCCGHSGCPLCHGTGTIPPDRGAAAQTNAVRLGIAEPSSLPTGTGTGTATQTNTADTPTPIPGPTSAADERGRGKAGKPPALLSDATAGQAGAFPTDSDCTLSEPTATGTGPTSATGTGSAGGSSGHTGAYKVGDRVRIGSSPRARVYTIVSIDGRAGVRNGVHAMLSNGKQCALSMLSPALPDTAAAPAPQQRTPNYACEPQGKTATAAAPAAAAAAPAPAPAAAPSKPAAAAAAAATAPPTGKPSEGGPQTVPGRTVGVRWVGGGGHYAILQITTVSDSSTGPKTEVADYLTEKISDLKHRITKLEPGRQTTYTVHLGLNDLDFKDLKEDYPSSCSCDGHRRHKHCRHVEALLALRATGRLA